MSARAETAKKQIKKLGEVIIWVIFAGTIIAVVSNIQKFKVRSPYFTVQNIELKIDSRRVENPSEAFVYLNIKKGTSIFDINPGKLVQEIMIRHPEVREAKVEKKLPRTLLVEVNNRIAVVQVRLTQFYPVDNEGFLLPYPSNFRLNNLPCLQGIDSSELKIGEQNQNPKLLLGLKVVALIRENFPQIYKNIDIDVADNRNIIVFLPSGIKVKLAEYNLKDKVSKLKIVLQDVKSKNLQPEFIDLRFDKAILIPKQR